ncbi:MAG: type II toxin-antitoxin system HicB family antitoxin [Acidobacteriota bacterium]
MQYAVVLEQEPDGGYVALVPVLPGCGSQGDTREEALHNIRKAAELYAEDCIASGDPVPAEAGHEFIELTLGN